jgi:prevent-host-death family protein
MADYSIRVAKANLSKLIARACDGEEVVIKRGTQPAVRLIAIATKPTGRRFGALRGRARVTSAFFEPLLAGELDAWRQ